MRVRVTLVSRSAVQSAPNLKPEWVLEPEVDSPRKARPPMGWKVTHDPLTTLCGRLRFPSAEAAQAFATRRGWDSFLEEPPKKRVRTEEQSR
jgi:hypothetical protein